MLSLTPELQRDDGKIAIGGLRFVPNLSRRSRGKAGPPPGFAAEVSRELPPSCPNDEIYLHQARSRRGPALRETGHSTVIDDVVTPPSSSLGTDDAGREGGTSGGR